MATLLRHIYVAWPLVRPTYVCFTTPHLPILHTLEVVTDSPAKLLRKADEMKISTARPVLRYTAPPSAAMLSSNPQSRNICWLSVTDTMYTAPPNEASFDLNMIPLMLSTTASEIAIAPPRPSAEFPMNAALQVEAQSSPAPEYHRPATCHDPREQALA